MTKAKQKRRGRNEGSVFQRADGRWCGTVDFGYDGNGKRQRKTVYGKTRKEAHDKLQEKLDERRKGMTDPSNETAGDWIEKYLKEAESRLRPRTLKGYRCATKNHITPIIGKLKLTKVKPFHIDRIYRKLEADGKHGVACVVAKVIKPAFRKAKRLGMIAINPAAEVDNPTEATANSKTWTPDEAETFLQAVKESREYALYYVAIMTGARLGELCALKWSNVRLDNGEFDIRLTAGMNSKKPVGPPKTKSSERTVTLSQSVVDVLYDHRAQSLREGNGASPWVFCAPRGGMQWPECVSKRKNTLMKDAGVTKIKFHEIRHFCPTSMLAAAVNPKIVSQQLGHNSVKMTLDRYSHVDITHQRQVSDAMETLMVKRRKTS